MFSTNLPNIQLVIEMLAVLQKTVFLGFYKEICKGHISEEWVVYQPKRTFRYTYFKTHFITIIGANFVGKDFKLIFGFFGQTRGLF